VRRGFSAAALSDGGLYDRNLKTNWDNLWEVGAEGAWGHPNTRGEVQLHYLRAAVIDVARGNAAKMIAQWGWGPTSDVIIVFCGFGWIVEALLEQGVDTVVCIEQSTYIQANKQVNEDIDLTAAITAVGLATNTGDGLTIFTAFRRNGDPRTSVAADIFDEDLTTKASRDRIADRVLSNDIHVVTYDGWLQTYTDAEAVALSANLNAIRGVRQVSHWVFFSDAWVPGIQDKSQIQWETLIPADEFVSL